MLKLPEVLPKICKWEEMLFLSGLWEQQRRRFFLLRLITMKKPSNVSGKLSLINFYEVSFRTCNRMPTTWDVLWSYYWLGFWKRIISFGFRHHKNMNILFKNIKVQLSKFQCGFLLGKVSTHNGTYKWCLKRKKPLITKHKAFGGLLTYLSKAFNCLSRDFFIAKFPAYCDDLLNMLQNNLTEGK